MVSYVVIQGKTVALETITKTYGMTFIGSLSLCNNIFKWYIDYNERKRTFDVTPDISSFGNISYNPYDVIDKVPLYDLLEDKNERIQDRVEDILHVLVGSFLADQSEKISILPKSVRSEFIFGMLEAIRDVSYLILAGGSQVLVQFPLLHQDRLNEVDLQYALEATCNHPIEIILDSGKIDRDDSFLVEPKLVFPASFPCSRGVGLPSWGPDSMLFDYIADVERRIATALCYRRAFTQELQRIAAVVDFDPLDFSFVSVALRLTQKKMAVICTADIRLPPSFPAAAPQLLVHDLQQDCDYSVEGNTCEDKQMLYAERRACETYIHICDKIYELAFQQS